MQRVSIRHHAIGVYLKGEYVLCAIARVQNTILPPRIVGRELPDSRVQPT